MNSVKKLSDENKSDVAEWVWKNEWWVMSDELWVMSDGNWVTEIEWWKMLNQTSPKLHKQTVMVDDEGEVGLAQRPYGLAVTPKINNPVR